MLLGISLLSFRRFWMANALRDPMGHKERGLQMIYGGCWNFVGNLTQMTDRLSTPSFSVCKTPRDYLGHRLT